MVHPANSSTRLLAAVWLAKLYLLDVGGGDVIHSVEAAPYHSYHANRHYQRRPRHGPPRPASRIYDDDEPSSSYFERNGLSPPPLISRRRAQTENEAAAAGDNTESSTDLDSIIQDAKYGEDANTRLRHDLIWGHDNYDKYYYDKHSYPWEYVWYNDTGKRTGVPVEMNINFHRVFSVDIVNSVMDLVVWFRLVWVDPRLTWKPEEYGNLNETWFWIGDGGAGGETSEIWTPDIELWNLETGLRGSLEDAYARVSHDGTVWWGRPGHLRPTCKFSGLNLFPFDRLTCTMEFGSWGSSGKYLRMEKQKGVGFSIGNSLTAGESYEEYSFAEEDPITCVQHLYTYESAPEDDWPVLLYNVTVARSWQPYARGYITVQVILNLIGFSAFWLPPSCGERMSLSVTAMLAALASEIVVAANLPAASEITWFSKFSILSMAFAFVSLLECVIVLYFYYKRSEDMVPSWYTFTKNWYLVRQAQKHGEEVKKRSSEMVARTTDFVTETTSTAFDAFHSTTDAISTGAKESVNRRSSSDDSTDSWDEDGLRDDNAKRVSNSVLSNVSDNDSSPTEVKSSEEQKSRSAGESGTKLGSSRRSAKLRLYEDQQGSTVMALLPTVPRDADDFHDDEEMENNMKWKYVAARIDDVARFWIPLAFVVSLSIVLAQAF